VTEVLWDVRLFDPETGLAADHQAITFQVTRSSRSMTPSVILPRMLTI
jgi:hypothetical protein